MFQNIWIYFVPMRDAQSMQKIATKTKIRDSEKATRVKKVAKIIGCSTKEVYRVIYGDVTTDQDRKILETYMALQEGENEVFENLLLKAVKQAVPFN